VESPSVSKLPSLETGRVTFGSFNTGLKINDKVIDLWSRIILSVPQSRLILKGKHFRDKEIVSEWQRIFAQKGISANAIELVGYVNSPYEHMKLYNSIDIALDTFPYNGTTTTCEALWMGAPVITLTGGHHASRVGTSILNNVGLTEWICETQEEYLKKAVGLAENLNKLSAIRGSLRQMFLSSPLMDEKSFVKNLESRYIKMVRNSK